MSMTEMNSIVRRIDKLTTTLKPEQEITIVCCWGDENLPTDSDTIEIKTSWAGGRLSDGDDQDRLELEDDYS